jgi:hypothetical protein
MKTRLHGIMGFLAMVIISLFFVSTVTVELMRNEQAVASVKQMIVYGLFILVPAMMLTGISGKAIVGTRQGRLIKTKMKRMIVVAANGILILIPCAIILNKLAISGTFNAAFYMIQGVELLAGAVNIVLMGMNIRDGLLLTGRIKKRRRMISNWEQGKSAHL